MQRFACLIGVAYAALLVLALDSASAVVGRAECPEPDAEDRLRVAKINDNQDPDYLLGETRDGVENAIQLWCCDGSEFCIRFVGIGGSPRRFIGRCRYFGGQNGGAIQGGDTDKDGRKDWFTRHEWHNRDNVNLASQASKTRNDYDNETTFLQRDCFYQYCAQDDKLIVCTTSSSQDPVNTFRQVGYFDDCEDTDVDHPADGVTLANCQIFEGSDGKFNKFPGAAGDAMRHCEASQGVPTQPSGDGGAGVGGGSGGAPSLGLASTPQKEFAPVLQLGFTHLGAGSFEYGILGNPLEPTFVHAGDVVILSRFSGVTSAFVASPLALPVYGGWQVVSAETTSTSVTFQATLDAVLPIGISVPGFRVQSTETQVTEVGWVSEGLSIGYQGVTQGPSNAPPPIPSLAPVALAILAACLLIGSRIARPRWRARRAH